jgi:hypothetical protein
MFHFPIHVLTLITGSSSGGRVLIELLCIHPVELRLLFIYSCFGRAVNLNSYQLISKIEIYNILNYADNKIAMYVAITVCSSMNLLHMIVCAYA